MKNKIFEGVNLMQKTKKPTEMHLYYIDELNGHLYIADRKFIANRFREFEVIDTNEVIIIEDFADQTSRQMKAYTSKEYALLRLKDIKDGME